MLSPARDFMLSADRMPPVDLATQDESLAAWAFVHPIAMATVIVLGLFVYGTGLRLRDDRLKQRQADQRQKDRHTRIAQPFVLLFLLGFVAGPLSSVYTRGWTAMTTTHGWLGSAAVLLFAAAGFLGMFLAHERSDRASLHGLLAVFGGMLAVAAALAGIELLP